MRADGSHGSRAHGQSIRGWPAGLETVAQEEVGDLPVDRHAQGDGVLQTGRNV